MLDIRRTIGLLMVLGLGCGDEEMATPSRGLCLRILYGCVRAGGGCF